MARTAQRVGIETRRDATGKERHRGYVHREQRKLRGPWRDSVTQARGDRANLLTRVPIPVANPPGYPTIRQAWVEWIANAEAGRAWTRSGARYAPSTLRGYRQAGRDHLLPELGDTPITELRRSRIQRLVDEVAAAHTGQTARNTATPLCALYRHLLARYDELSDPTHGLQLPRGSQPRQHVVSPAELDALLCALPEGDRDPLALAGIAGLRLGEIRALLAEDVLLDEGLVVVRRSWDPTVGPRPTKSRAGQREVPIFAALRPILETQFRSLGPEPVLFLPGAGRWGGAIGAGQSFSDAAYMARARKLWDAAGLGHLGFHEARYSFASWLILGGYEVAVVSRWIGHSHASTTLDRYVKPLRQRGILPASVVAYLGTTRAEA